MPPKSAKSKASIKADVHDKVREIRLRQQKWMSERQTSLKTSVSQEQGASPKSKNVPTPSKNSNAHAVTTPQTAGHDIQTPSGQPVTTDSDPSMQKNTGFYSWLSTRQNGQHGPEQESAIERAQSGLDGSYSSCMTDNDSEYTIPSVEHSHQGHIPPLHLPPSVRSAASDYSDILPVSSTVEHDNHDDHSILPAQQFDVLADEIVHRVKKELHLANKQQDVGAGEMNPLSKEGQVQVRENTANIASHSCPVCSQAMTGSSHRPLLLIPCGHTACQVCAHQGSSCPICGLQVQSATPNIMLQQIIMDYHTQRRGSHDKEESHDQIKRPTKSKREQGGGKDDRNELGRTYSQMPMIMPKQPPQKSAAEYEEEYRNLLLRCDVLHEEEQSICDKMANLDVQKQNEFDQIDNITHAQERMEQEIKTLQLKIKELDDHKSNYRTKIDELESRRNKERRKLEMVRTTVLQLKGDIKKIKTELQMIS